LDGTHLRHTEQHERTQNHDIEQRYRCIGHLTFLRDYCLNDCKNQVAESVFRFDTQFTEGDQLPDLRCPVSVYPYVQLSGV
jgi:hypothetical protein